ncbi:protein kinase domain-containing protein [Colletotrichum higginsianum]|nr:protein kinase domain-containing protein [Colletotrichum higginsianum]
MVDDYMLVKKDRWSAKKICLQFDKLFGSTEPEESQVPKDLHTLLQRIDLQSEQMHQKSGLRRRAKQLPQVPNLPPADVEFESRRILLEQAIQPVAQRSRDRMVLPAHSRTRTSSTTQPPDSPVKPRETITAWQVRTELMKTGMRFRPNLKSFSSLFKPKPVPVKGKNMSEHLDQRLEVEFKNRDIVYLIDNGTTMASHWLQVTHLLEVLVWRSLGYDDNGMELYFTDPDTDPRATVTESCLQQVEDFTKAMMFAQPDEPKSPTQAVNTTIVPELARIINRYTRAKASKRPPRKKTIIILTDGIWNGMQMEHTIDIYLRSIIHELRDLHGDLSYIQPGKSQEQVDISTIRPVTIQFVQFGHDMNAVERLRRLDDDMRLYGCP